MKVLNSSQAEHITQLAVKRLADYIKNSGLKYIVLGISGGIDSAVVGAIGLLTAARLRSAGYEINLSYSFIDIESDPYDLYRAREMAQVFEFNLEEYNLTDWYQSSPLLRLIPINHPEEKVMRGNIKCRLRMISLYQFAKQDGGIYLDTDDLSEYYMGFWTKHGDEGDVKIIQHLTKAEVYDLGEHLGIPQSILQSKPGDGLGVSNNNLATDQLKLPYIEIDYIISRFLQNGFDTNGNLSQLEKAKYIELIDTVSSEIHQTSGSIRHVLHQSLKTAFKRKYGENVAHLLPDRTELWLYPVGTIMFNELYLQAILIK